MFTKVWKFLKKIFTMEFLSIKVQTYSVTGHRFFLEYLQKTNCLKKNEKIKSLLFEEKVYDGQAS